MSPPHAMFSSTENTASQRPVWQNLRAMLPYLWDYRGRVVASLLALVLAKVTNVGIPLVLKDIVDTLDKTSHQTLVLPIALLAMYGALRLSSSLFNELRDALFARVRYRAMRNLSNRTLSHLHALSLRFHLERQTGAVSRDIERGTRSVSSLLNYLVFNIFPTIIELLLIGGILLAKYDIVFTLVTLTTVTIYVVFTFLVMDWRVQYRHLSNAKESEANMQAIDSLVNYETVKSFCNEKFEAQRYDRTLGEWEEAATQSQVSMSALNFGQSAIIAIGVTLIMIFAAQGVVDNKMSLGDLVLVNAFLLQLFIPLNFLGMIYRATKNALIDMDALFQLLEKKPEVNDVANASNLQVGEGQIRFEQVSFHYQSNRQILHEVDFTIPAGHKIAVVGASGAGKSTLARLLFRFYDVSNGSIKINGQDIRQVTQHSLREAIGIVPQDTVLFNNTLLYNLQYARPDASQADIEEAVRLANIDEFIKRLPKGYDTIVGERGLKLSGGEKQRIAIARAVLKRPKILIFDEATSSLDSKSEQAIQTALAQVAENHTTLVIAHRLSTIIDANQILVMEHGRIIERGTHQQLLEQQGTYAHLWTLQQQQRSKENENSENSDN